MFFKRRGGVELISIIILSVILGVATEGGLSVVEGGESGEGKRTARFVIGTTQAGWTAGDVDYLCTGTDDHVQINNALNALPAGGGEIVILDGTYNIEGAIHVAKDNTTLRGNGNATVLKRIYNSASTDEGNTARGLITLNGKKGCKIKDLYIDGNRDNYSSTYNYGIYLVSSSSDNTVTGNICNNNGNTGICLSSSNNNTMSGNTCNNNGTYGIDLDNSNNNTVTGNTCNNNGPYGIRSGKSSSDNTISGNTCNNNVSGIYLNNSNNSTITGNTCNNNETYGIYLFSSGDNTINNTISGNTCNNNGTCGICLYSSSNNTVTGNTCNNNSSYGIHLSSSSSNNCIVENVLVDNNTAYLDEGGGTGNIEANNVKKNK